MKIKTIVSALTLVLLCEGQALAQISRADVDAMRARGEKEGWTFSVAENEATRYAREDLCGLVAPKDWRSRARFASVKAQADLPASFDWRPYCTPIRNQGGCGSCWAFSTVGVLESAISIKDGAMVNLSEQWLISCNMETEPPHLLAQGVWGCDGGWFAHDYFESKPDECGQSGAVLEADFPYVYRDEPCNCPEDGYDHYYWIGSWAYIAGEEEIPSVESIKQAIVTYGPVSAAVYADDPFQAYDDGVFNASTIEEVNHAIVLVGWDDNLGSEGAWILRNSWATHWGMDGYMYIEYGCSNVGFAACYIDYPGGGPGVDGDGDGLSNVDEARDLDPDAEGVQNPFDPYDPDSTGDCFEDGPDGVPDGRNDWDCDGVTNAREFAFGYDPTDPEDWPALPLVRVSGCAVLALLILAAARRVCGGRVIAS
jgi:C1A family cysteine protease